jgi:FKBP-type peptidyl-prolyl cis-trans isomerase SlyD
MSNTIADNLVVSLNYTLEVDGETVAQTDAGDPMEYLHGHENIVPGLEAALTGKKLGDKMSVTLPPDQAYGDYDPEDTDQIDRADLEHMTDLEVGMAIEVEDEEGEVYVAFVREITDESVVLDFNPPLAGKTLTYHVEVIGIREATVEEIQHGHVHGMDWMDDEEWDEDDLEDYDDEDDWEDDDDAADANGNKR